ncbi:hypothetical protein RhiirA5_411642 [Rhizophagus irregularis]|uniref:Uncharacterized protein n=1 Tax=Rhizophagus irregularis TaxID=588596 RepID=A0A2N0S1A3_9GLOM|nr:hypothetical protein RhiirA5_411642 [Rhizophagus irregularis]PKC69340.1 hypothetical protein RhiirA1_456152 [Rhizophagus irregularis]
MDEAIELLEDDLKIDQENGGVGTIDQENDHGVVKDLIKALKVTKKRQIISNQSKRLKKSNVVKDYVMALVVNFLTAVIVLSVLL